LTITDTIKQTLGQHDDVEAIQKRADECAKELADVGIEQATLQRALHGFEKASDVKSADEVAAKLESTYKQLERLRIRQRGIASALEDAKAERATVVKAERIADLKAKLTKAAAVADKTGEKVATSILDLSSALAKFREATFTERGFFDEQARLSGTPWSPVTSGRRSLAFCEEIARKRADTIATESVNVPTK
jgi:hypothetical protein